MEYLKASERRIKVIGPDDRDWVNVWFRIDGGERIQIDVPAGSWTIEEAHLPSGGQSGLVLRRR